MEAAFWRMAATAGVVSAFLAVLLIPARRWMIRRWAPQVRWGLWLGMAAVLILGIFVSGFAAVPETVWEIPAYSVELPAVPAEHPEGSGGAGATPLPEGGRPAGLPEAADSGTASAPSSGEQTLAPEPAVRRAVTVSFADAAGAVWLAGAAAVLLRQGVRYGRMRRRLLAASFSGGACEAMLREIGVEADVRILPGLESPMALGIFRPAVLLPEGAVPPLAVRHELIHLRRRDLAGKAVLFLACALYWFDPLVWRMARAAGEDMEAACDAELVRDLTAAEKRAYGELLLAAAGGRAAPLTTRFGGSGAQMKARLTQLFQPGKPRRALACGLLAAAFLATGLAACRSGGPGAAEVKDGIFYAVPDWSAQLENTDCRTLTLETADFSPGADWLGGSTGTVTLPVAEQVRLEERTVSGDAEADLFSFLCRPQLRSYALSGTADVLRVEVRDGAVTAMDWFEGVTNVGGVLWQTPGGEDVPPFVLRLPEELRGRFSAENIGGQWAFSYESSGGKRIRMFRVVWDPLSVLDEFRTEQDPSGYGGMVSELVSVLGEGGGYLFRLVAEPADAWFDPEDRSSEADAYRQALQLASGIGPEDFRCLSPDCSYTSARYGFTLALPDSWQGHFYAEETLQGVEFYYRTDGALLCSLIVRTEPAAEEAPDTARAKPAGSGNGWYVDLSMPQLVPANLFEDLAQGLRCQRMYRDFLRLYETDAWTLTFAQGEDAVFPVSPPEAEPSAAARGAFARVLRDLMERSLLPDGTQTDPSARQGALAENRFAVADVDGDGAEELVLYFTTAATADQRGMVLGYDEAADAVRIQLTDTPSLEFYENGAVKALYSHNQTSGALWPYTLYTYDEAADSYRQEAIVYSWDKKVQPVGDRGEPFPDELDRSGSGVIYYVEPDGWNDSNPLDQAEYRAWEAEALPASGQLTLQFFPLTGEAVDALER